MIVEYGIMEVKKERFKFRQILEETSNSRVNLNY